MESFAFLVHPMSIGDVTQRIRMTRLLPAAWCERMITWCPPLRMGEMSGIGNTGAGIGGHFISVMLTTRQMLELPPQFVLKRIIQAGRLAEKLGARILGLGAYTSVVGDAGITVARQLGIAVTTGNSLTAAAAIAGTREAARLMDINLDQAAVVVVGATGSIGRAVCSILAGEVRHIRLVARDQRILEETAGRLRQLAGNAVDVDFTTDLRQALRQADVVLATSSAPEALIHPEDLKPGAVVCDIARPRDTSERVAREREDVLVFDGGLLEVPGDFATSLNYGLPPGLTYACMAETMILTLEQRYQNFSLGRELDPEKVAEIYQLALKHGFKLAALRYQEQVLDPARCRAVKEAAAERRRRLIRAG